MRHSDSGTYSHHLKEKAQWEMLDKEVHYMPLIWTYDEKHIKLKLLDILIKIIYAY